MALIEIEGMEFYAYHGHYKEEQVVGNKFLVNLSIEADTNKAENSDNLHDTVNYQTAYLLIKEQMQSKSHLLEHLAARILSALTSNLHGIRHVKVKISKMNPPMGGKIEKVSVTLEQSL